MDSNCDCYTAPIEDWRAEFCEVIDRNATACNDGLGNFFESLLAPQNCSSDMSSICIYDASDETDCELSAGHNISDLRVCWVKYNIDGKCDY